MTRKSLWLNLLTSTSEVVCLSGEQHKSHTTYLHPLIAEFCVQLLSTIHTLVFFVWLCIVSWALNPSHFIAQFPHCLTFHSLYGCTFPASSFLFFLSYFLGESKLISNKHSKYRKPIYSGKLTIHFYKYTKRVSSGQGRPNTAWGLKQTLKYWGLFT
jgi:hypothetical protein